MACCFGCQPVQVTAPHLHLSHRWTSMCALKCTPSVPCSCMQNTFHSCSTPSLLRVPLLPIQQVDCWRHTPSDSRTLMETHSFFSHHLGDTLLPLFVVCSRHRPSSSNGDTPTDLTHGPIPTHGELSVVAAWRHTRQAFLTHREILFASFALATHAFFCQLSSATHAGILSCLSLSMSILSTILLIVCRSCRQLHLVVIGSFADEVFVFFIHCVLIQSTVVTRRSHQRFFFVVVPATLHSFFFVVPATACIDPVKGSLFFFRLLLRRASKLKPSSLDPIDVLLLCQITSISSASFQAQAGLHWHRSC